MMTDITQMHRLHPGDITTLQGQLDLAEFLPEYKFQCAIKRLSRGITHDYNNIFAGLSGQLAMHARDGFFKGVNTNRRRMIEDLLQRGVDRTAMFFEFCRLQKEPPKFLSTLRVIEKGVDLLNCVSKLHHFDLRVDTVDLPKIYGCYQELLLMIFYLGENCIDATPEGGMVRVEIRLQAGVGDKPDIVFEMADDGGGFTENMLTVTDIVSIIRTRGAKVISGAGLFAVAQTVAEHDGSLFITNRKGGGALVRVVIPAAELNYTELEHLEWGIEEKVATLEPRPEEKFIFLIVDDEESIRSILLDQFQRRGHVVFCVSSCKEAMEEFVELSDIITAVLLDVGLKDCSGYECLDRLFRIKPDVRVIMMSGEEFTGRSKHSEAVNYIRKPFTVEIVENLCRQ